MVFLDDPGSSPVEDSSITFPYEEIEARICLGVRSSTKDGAQQGSMSPGNSGGVNTVTSHSRLSNSSKPSQPSSSSSPSVSSPPPSAPPPTAAWSGGRIGGGDAAAIAARPEPGLSYGSTGSIHSTGGSRSRLPKHPSSVQQSSSESKGHGKETKGANISGIIKSKTADFEKLAKKSLGTPQRTPRRSSRQVIRTEDTPATIISSSGESGEVPAGSSTSATRGKTAIGLSRSSIDLAQAAGVGTSSSAPSTATSSSSGGGPTTTTWKRSEIIASPARKKQETFL